MTDSNNYKRQ